jgi:hypothetical protein
MTILRMIEQGKLSAEDGARLLAALGGRHESERKARPQPFDTARQLHVRVSDLATKRQKVQVSVPVGLVEVVLRWLPATAQSEVAAVQAAIDSGTSGRLLDVTDHEAGVRVEITLV